MTSATAVPVTPEEFPSLLVHGVAVARTCCATSLALCRTLALANAASCPEHRVSELLFRSEGIAILDAGTRSVPNFLVMIATTIPIMAQHFPLGVRNVRCIARVKA